jgi:hypothetical protein
MMVTATVSAITVPPTAMPPTAGKSCTGANSNE